MGLGQSQDGRAILTIPLIWLWNAVFVVGPVGLFVLLQLQLATFCFAEKRYKEDHGFGSRHLGGDGL